MTNLDVAPLEGYPEPYGTLLSALLDGTREWRYELGTPELRHITWQPVEHGHSIGAVLLHIAEAESYWIGEFCMGCTLTPKESAEQLHREIQLYQGKWPTPPSEPLSFYYDILDRVRARTLESVKHFEEPSTRKSIGFDTLTLRWILAHISAHESYHAGQAVLLHELAKRSGIC